MISLYNAQRNYISVAQTGGEKFNSMEIRFYCALYNNKVIFFLLVQHQRFQSPSRTMYEGDKIETA